MASAPTLTLGGRSLACNLHTSMSYSNSTSVRIANLEAQVASLLALVATAPAAASPAPVAPAPVTVAPAPVTSGAELQELVGRVIRFSYLKPEAEKEERYTVHVREAFSGPRGSYIVGPCVERAGDERKFRLDRVVEILSNKAAAV